MELLSPETLTIIGIVAVVIFLIIGFIKRTMWLIIVAVIIGGGTFISQPETVETIKEVISDIAGGVFEPLEDEDYSDMKENLKDEIKN
jgi:hypothetical protein